MPQELQRGWTHAANRQSASRFHFKLSRSKMSQGLGRMGSSDVTQRHLAPAGMGVFIPEKDPSGRAKSTMPEESL